MADRLHGHGPDQLHDRDTPAHQAHGHRQAGVLEGVSVVSGAAAMALSVAA